jgi:S-adenosylmethionine hydrolase
MEPVITLLTDFGTRDAYVGAMKGVILSICPGARVVDITHEVAPQDIVEGAWTLAAAARHFPSGTVHVAVVDPGVGGARRAVAVRAGRWRFVGPDNGVLSWAVAAACAPGALRAVELNDARWFGEDVSRTFHGRDIFAPVAAHLAAGARMEDLGPPVRDLTALPVPAPVATGDELAGEVVHIDRFGNAITNIDRPAFDAWRQGREAEVSAGGRVVGSLRGTYAEAQPGEALALFESTGRLEIAVREGSAAQALGLARGAQVRVRAASPGAA